MLHGCIRGDAKHPRRREMFCLPTRCRSPNLLFFFRGWPGLAGAWNFAPHSKLCEVIAEKNPVHNIGGKLRARDRGRLPQCSSSRGEQRRCATSLRFAPLIQTCLGRALIFMRTCTVHREREPATRSQSKKSTSRTHKIHKVRLLASRGM